jgi:hypothetical protein
MNLLVSSPKFANAAHTAARAVPANQRFPALERCRQTAGDNLGIYGTDLDSGRGPRLVQQNSGPALPRDSLDLCRDQRPFKEID